MKQTIAIIAALIAAIINGRAEESRPLIDLRGTWKFEIGDSKQWADPKFDDSKWNEIFVPADWENEGFPGYDGYGWYRKTFMLPQSTEGKNLYMHLIVDDVCDVYVNGNLIGEGGKFPPRYETAYNTNHEFYIPPKFLRYNQQNVIAVRVFDDHLHGGIVGGRVGIHEHRDAMKYVVKLPDMWKFKIGDEEEWKDASFDDSKWQELIVPAKWDFQGYKDFDGFAWYRVSFDVPSNVKDEELILMLGKIDDIDETYLNGEMIGRTGRIRSDGSVRKINNEYQEYRGYSIPKNALKIGQKNILAVRVYDKFSYGGIYEGPIGIVRERDYRKFENLLDRNDYNDNNKWERILDKIFNGE